MELNIEDKKNFILEFQNRILLARNLLKGANHQWADRVLSDLYLKIEKNDWLDIQKKHKLIMLISNSWWTYIQNLQHRNDLGLESDYILYVDASKRFFSFLSKLNDFYLLNTYYEDFLRQILEKQDLSEAGISKFINSFSSVIKRKGFHLRLIELQVLLCFLTKTTSPTKLFSFSLEELSKIIIRLEPGKRALFLYILLENVNIKYQLSDNFEFVKEVSNILLTKIPQTLKHEFGTLKRLIINPRNFSSFLPDLEEIIDYLHNIGEPSWISSILKNVYNKLKEYQSFEGAIKYIQRYIIFFLERNRYDIVFELYNFLEDIYIYQTDLSYDKSLIELWAEACINFSTINEKKYLLQALEKLNTQLKTPQSEEDIFHYFYTFNYIWRIKSVFSSIEESEFWNMLFYRALFEEKNLPFSKKIIQKLPHNIQPCLSDLSNLMTKADFYKRKIYAFEDTIEENSFFDPNFIIRQLIINISIENKITCYLKSIENKVIEIPITNEYWNDLKLEEIYEDIFFKKNNSDLDLSIKDFGFAIYLLLPKMIRDFFSQFEISRINFTPEILFKLEEISFPFELMHKNEYLMLNYSSSYYIDNLLIEGISFEDEVIDNKLQAKVLLIENINSMGPFKWIDYSNTKELIYSFPEGKKRIDFIKSLFMLNKEVDVFKELIENSSSRNSILDALKEGQFNIIHIIGNIIYSTINPQESYLITNDNKILKLKEIFKTSINSKLEIKPFIFLDIQVFDIDGNKIKNPIKTFRAITSIVQMKNFLGIVIRISSDNNKSYEKIIASFYKNLIKGERLGYSILNARKENLTSDVLTKLENDVDRMTADDNNSSEYRDFFIIPNYLVFGLPWDRLK